MENRTFDIYCRLKNFHSNSNSYEFLRESRIEAKNRKTRKKRRKDKSKTISFRGSSPIVFHDLGRGRCETDGRRKRTEEKRKLVSQRYLNTVYNTDKNKEKKIEI